MTNQQTDMEQLLRICNGNKEAAIWLQIGRRYVHEIDDLIDEDIPKADRVSGGQRACLIGSLAIELFTHPFFIRHSAILATAMMTMTNNYADSLRWEKSQVPWQSGFSDWSRHAWLDVVLIVAYICGGYEAMRNEAAELRAMSYADHHDAKGEVA